MEDSAHEMNDGQPTQRSERVLSDPHESPTAEDTWPAAVPKELRALKHGLVTSTMENGNWGVGGGEGGA